MTNRGNVTLHGVKVSDPRSPACNRSLGTLAPGRSVTYACKSPHVTANFLNSATATGTSPRGTKVKATDQAMVWVKQPRPSSTG